MDDPFDLRRFVEAQDAGRTYEAVLRELRRGHKQTHWMWFVFPQIAGLGRSSTARHYAISGLIEAAHYLAHPVLGARLLTCARVVDGLAGSDAVAVFGSIDAQKLQSSMTLFGRADPDEAVFPSVIEHYFAGRIDDETIALLRAAQMPPGRGPDRPR